MTTANLSDARLTRMDEVMHGFAERGDIQGLTWLVSRRGEIHTGASGTVGDDGPPVGTDTIFRIASMTKPISAVAALLLLEEGRFGLDDAIDPWIPELADRRVLADPHGSIDDTVPAHRPISVRDLLTFRLGHGFDFVSWHLHHPVLEAAAELGIGIGPPTPGTAPSTDEWIKLLGQLPLSHQPGQRWLYNTGSEVLGLFVERVAGRPFDAVLEERIFQPLGMHDTAFFVPADQRHRFGPCHGRDEATGERTVFDPPDGGWSAPPAFPNGAGGLVSTVGDYQAFASMLLAGGRYAGGRLLSRPTIDAMTTNQLTDAQVAASSPDPTGEGTLGWGFGVGVQLRRVGPAMSVGSYTWNGGLGSLWVNDPVEELTAVLLTSQTWTSPVPPPVIDAFLTTAYAVTPDRRDPGPRSRAWLRRRSTRRPRR